MNVTVSEVLAATRARTASLVAETAGYLVLATADQIASAPRIALFEHIKLENDGSVRVLGGVPAESVEAERSLRRLLAELMLAAGSATPALVRASKRESGSGIEQLIRELEAALIPVNRAASRRALSRLHRETARAAAMLEVAPGASLVIQAAPLDVAAPPRDAVRKVAGDAAFALLDFAAAVNEPVHAHEARPDPAPPAPRPTAVREPTPPLAVAAAVEELPLSVASALALPVVETRPPPAPIPDASPLAPAATAIDGTDERTREPAGVEPSWDSSRLETVAPFAVETVAVASMPPARAARAAAAIADVPAAVFVPSAERDRATTYAASVEESRPLSARELEPVTHPEPVVVRRRASSGDKRTPPFGTFAGYEPSVHDLAQLSPDDVTERMPPALDLFEEQEHELDCAEHSASPEIGRSTELLPVDRDVVEPAAALLVDAVVSDAFDVVEIEPSVPDVDVDVDVDVELDANSQRVDEGAPLAAAEPIATSESMACEAVNEPTPSEAASESIASEALSAPVAVVMSEPFGLDVRSEPVAVEVVSEALPCEALNEPVAVEVVREAIPESASVSSACEAVSEPVPAEPTSEPVPESAGESAATEAFGREEPVQGDDESIDSRVGAESAPVDEGSAVRSDDPGAEATVADVVESGAAVMELASALPVAEMEWMTFVAVAPIEAALLLAPSLAEDDAAAEQAAAPIEAPLARSPSSPEQDGAPIEAAAPGVGTEAAVPVPPGDALAPVAMGEAEVVEPPAEDIDLSELEESASKDSAYGSEQQPLASSHAGELDAARARDSIAEAPLADTRAARRLGLDESLADVPVAEVVAADEPVADVETPAGESLAGLLGAQWATNDDQLVDVPPAEALAAVEPIADAELLADAESPFVEGCAVEGAAEDAPLAEIPAVESVAIDELPADPEAAAEAPGFDASVADVQAATQSIAADEFVSGAAPVAEQVAYEVPIAAAAAVAEPVAFDGTRDTAEAAAGQPIAAVSMDDVDIGRAWLSPEPPPSLGQVDEVRSAEVQSGWVSFDEHDAAEPPYESLDLRTEWVTFDDWEAEQLCDWFALQREWASLDEDGAAVQWFEPIELQGDAASFDQPGAVEELIATVTVDSVPAGAVEGVETVTVDSDPAHSEGRYADEQPLESVEVDELDEGNLPIPVAWPRGLPRLELVISAEPPVVMDKAGEGEPAEPAISAESEAAVDLAAEPELSERPPIGDFADRAPQASDQCADPVALDAAFWTIDSECAEEQASPSLSSIDAGWPELTDSVIRPASAFCSDDAEPVAEIERESAWLGESDILDARAELIGVEAPPLRESDSLRGVISNESFERALPDVEPYSPSPLAGAALRADCPTPPKSPPAHPSAPELAPRRFAPRQSDVEELLAGFATSAARSDRDLCKDLQSLAGIGLTPLPPGFE